MIRPFRVLGPAPPAALAAPAPPGAASAALQSDANLFQDLGPIGPPDLSSAFQEKYRQTAVE